MENAASSGRISARRLRVLRWRAGPLRLDSDAEGWILGYSNRIAERGPRGGHPAAVSRRGEGTSGFSASTPAVAEPWNDMPKLPGRFNS